MIIVNPIYDTAFKYLMEDTEIAREMLAVIINENIISLTVLPQEQVLESQETQLKIVRFDFKAIIRTPDGQLKKILIELQKGKHNLDIQRFRRYLGLNYLQTDTFGENDETVSLPIVSVYILGFSLRIGLPVIHVKRLYVDRLLEEPIHQGADDFIESLTHDSYVIQVPQLQASTQTQLDRVLLIFNQKFIIGKDRKKLDIPLKIQDDLVEKMLYRLSIAAKDREIAQKMRDEDEFDDQLRRYIEKQKSLMQETINIMGEENKQLAREKKKIGEENKQLTKEKKRVEAENKQIEAEKKRVEAENKQIEAEKKRIEAENKQIEAEKKRVEAENKQIEAEKKRVEAENKQIEAEKKRVEAENKQIEAEKKRIEAENKQIEAEKKRVEEENAALRKRLADLENKD